MKHFHRFTCFLAFFLLLTGTMPDVSAYTVSSVNVNPPGYQVAGTPMTVSFVIDFPKGGTETFPQESEMQMSTGLANAYWAPAMVLDGIQTAMDEKTGQSLTMSGWYLSYPSYQDFQLRVTLMGKIPENPAPGQDLLKIEEVNSGHTIRSTARVAIPETLLVPLSTPSPPSTPTKKPTTKKIFTPIPTATPTQESPLGIEAAVVAILGAVFLGLGRR
jgi:hypothetical protein